MDKFIWCANCLKKHPPKITRASKLVPVRATHYSLASDNLNIDNRVVGICDECLSESDDFKKKNTLPADINNDDLVYVHI